MRITSGGRALALSLAGAVAASAALAAPPADRWTATNLPGAAAYAELPAGFDALHASDESLAALGFPPRPDPLRHPRAYAAWARAVDGQVERIAPVLEPTTMRHGPAVGKRRIAEGAALSRNWSGYVLLSGATSYGAASFDTIYGDWIVPVAQTAFGACATTPNGAQVYSSAWVGIDGDQSADVLQAGTEADAQCVNGKSKASYSAWYEWYPNYMVRIANMPVGAGDAVQVYVWSTSPTQGHAYFANLSRNLSASLAFNAPAGTQLVGDTAEWIVERPNVNGSLANLTNYTLTAFTTAYVTDFSARTRQPNDPSAVAVSMVDNLNAVISAASLLGPQALVFQNSGSSR